MTLEFQTELLQFLVQSRNGKKYVEILQPEIFDLDDQYTVFGIIKGFVEKYKSQPTLPSLLEYFDLQAQNSKADVPKEVYAKIVETIRECYISFTGNSDFIREQIIKKYQIKLMTDLFANKMLDLKNGDEDVVKDIYKNVSKIKKLEDNNEDEEANKGKFALQEFKIGQRTQITATATYLKTLNRMTSTGGFYAPQLIILMGAPKSFKTGNALNLAMNFVRDGYKVYYVDCENGEDRILDRFYQAMLEAEGDEYNDGDLDEVLKEMITRFKMRGGDFRSDFYPAHTKSMADVEDCLEAIEEEYNWRPDIIIYDYLDLMKPEDYTIKEKRLQIQAVYHDAIRLQKRRNIFGMSPSQVNKDAVNKAVIDMTGFAEDFGKASNCHAAFAICRTDDEKQAGVGRIVPVLQRDGVAQSSNIACFIDIKEAKMSVTEIDYEEWKDRVEIVKSGMEAKKSRKRPRTKDLTDD